MHILIEGQTYLTKDLESIFNDSKFYIQRNEYAVLSSVGYYYSVIKREVIYMLPKVFMSSGVLESIEEGEKVDCKWDTYNTIFKKNDSTQYLTLKELFEIDKFEGSFKHENKYEWVRHITVSFYNSLIEFKRRNWATTILNSGITNDLNSNIGTDEYTYLDLVLSFTNFYKKNKSVILFHHIEYKSNQAKKPKWEKTIRKTIPIINKSRTPIYLEINNKKKIINNEEELITYFFSILNHFKEENNLNISIDKSYNIIKGEAFKNLQLNGLGLSKLRKIKYKYFSDTMKRMYKLCELYFDSSNYVSIRKRDEEFISFNNYNIVFEDMVDKLLSEHNNINAYDSKKNKDEINIKHLKHNNDGKIIDHLFEYDDLIDTSNIFYIGDSKYYKPGNTADKLSVYKQFTYAKNIIQFNIDLFNNGKEYASEKIKYRDELTEGYNITPNFLLYGVINDNEDFYNDHISPISDKSVKQSFHWKTRIFDRDSLFIYQYKINYLFVLHAYTEKSESSLIEFRKSIKEKFRNNFIKYLEDSTISEFTFYKVELDDLKQFVHDNFKILNGKCFSLNNRMLLIALHKSDIGEGSLREFIQQKNLIDLTPDSDDVFKFNINKTKTSKNLLYENDKFFKAVAEEETPPYNNN